MTGWTDGAKGGIRPAAGDGLDRCERGTHGAEGRLPRSRRDHRIRIEREQPIFLARGLARCSHPRDVIRRMDELEALGLRQWGLELLDILHEFW